MHKPTKLNPYLSIKFHTSLGLLLTNNFSKISYSLNKVLLKNLLTGKSSNELISNEIFYKSSDFKTNEILKKKTLEFFNLNVDTLTYHMLCYKYPFLDYQDEKAYDVDWALMEKYFKKRKPVSRFKEYKKSVSKIQLRSPDLNFDYNIIQAVSGKENKNLDLSTEDMFGLFTLLCFGKNPKRKDSKYLHKLVPSGGAKHPTEVYIIFPKSSFYSAGVYHYNVDLHILECVKQGDFYSTLNITESKFAIIYTSMVERAMFRYRDLRSTRAILMDLGHVIENSKIIGSALGLKCETLYSVDENIISKTLGLTNKEPVLALQIIK